MNSFPYLFSQGGKYFQFVATHPIESRRTSKLVQRWSACWASKEIATSPT